MMHVFKFSIGPSLRLAPIIEHKETPTRRNNNSCWNVGKDRGMSYHGWAKGREPASLILVFGRSFARQLDCALAMAIRPCNNLLLKTSPQIRQKPRNEFKPRKGRKMTHIEVMVGKADQEMNTKDAAYAYSSEIRYLRNRASNSKGAPS